MKKSLKISGFVLISALFLISIAKRNDYSLDLGTFPKSVVKSAHADWEMCYDWYMAANVYPTPDPCIDNILSYFWCEETGDEEYCRSGNVVYQYDNCTQSQTVVSDQSTILGPCELPIITITTK